MITEKKWFIYNRKKWKLIIIILIDADEFYKNQYFILVAFFPTSAYN